MEFKTESRPKVSDELSKDKSRKFILLAFREYTKREWEEFDKWGMTIYEYTSDSANGRSMAQLFEKYDVIVINIVDVESAQFYSLSRGDPLLDTYSIHVCSLCTKRRSERDCSQFGIVSQLKRFLSAKNAAEFVRYLLVGDPKKVRPEWQETLIKLGEGCVGFFR